MLTGLIVCSITWVIVFIAALINFASVFSSELDADNFSSVATRHVFFGGLLSLNSVALAILLVCYLANLIAQ